MKRSVETVVDVVKLLTIGESSPTQLARKTKSDIRTINQILYALVWLRIAAYDSLKLSGKQYRVFRLTEKYRKMRGVTRWNK